MANIYRLTPVLWTHRDQSLTVYAVDRPLPAIRTQCSARPKEDPASYWDSTTVHRLLPTWDGSEIDAVTWSTLPRWLSYIQTVGYVADVDFSELKPYSDIYIRGP